MQRSTSQNSTPTTQKTQKSPSQNGQLLMSEVISAFSYALDLTEGQPAGHCVRCCWIGMTIGHKIGLDRDTLWDLYYTLLLKDAGCSSNAARLCELYGGDERSVKRDFKIVDPQKTMNIVQFVFEHVGVGQSLGKRLKKLLYLSANGEKLAKELVTTRCERGADIARKLGFNENIANGIRHLDEHWNGKGKPYHIAESSIPINSRIALLAQVIDVFYAVGGKQSAIVEVEKRTRTWFDPDLVKAFSAIKGDSAFWNEISNENIDNTITGLEPVEKALYIDDRQLDNITEAFGMVVDSKSPYTANHSTRVAMYTLAIAEEFGFDENRRRWLRRGALLHDIGKLGVSNAILDKPGKLTDEEWAEVKRHPGLTEEILLHLKPFEKLAKIAGAHHERLDGTGYPHGTLANDIPLDTRIITVADIFDAITADRPYRGPIPVKKALEIMDAECGKAIDGDCLDALKNRLPQLEI